MVIIFYIKRSSLVETSENRMFERPIVRLSDINFCLKTEQNVRFLDVLVVRTKFGTKQKGKVREPNVFGFWHSTVHIGFENRPWMIRVCLLSSMYVCIRINCILKKPQKSCLWNIFVKHYSVYNFLHCQNPVIRRDRLAQMDERSLCNFSTPRDRGSKLAVRKVFFKRDN